MSVVIPSVSQVSRRLRLLSPFRSQAAPELLMSRQALTPFAESFRLLAMNVQAMLAASARKGVVVTSLYPGDGRSLIAANLAIALAAHSPVLLVEEDVATRPDGRRARMLPAEGRPPANGAPEWMRGANAATNHSNLYVMSRAGINGTGLRAAVARASDAGMYMIIDSPPMLASSEPFLLAQEAGNALYVVRSKSGDIQAHRRVRDQLDRLHVNLLGLVMNDYQG